MNILRHIERYKKLIRRLIVDIILSSKHSYADRVKAMELLCKTQRRLNTLEGLNRLSTVGRGDNTPPCEGGDRWFESSTVRYGFLFFGTVVRVIDGDTILVDPQVYPQDQFLRIRLKDAWAVESGDDGGQEATEEAMKMFPVGSRIRIHNTRIHWTFGRLEARIDRT